MEGHVSSWPSLQEIFMEKDVKKLIFSMNKSADENISEPIPAAWLWSAWLTAIIASLCLFAANLIFGNLNQDEGWYLYAAKLIASGKMPYRDFAFTQGPVMPFIYSLLYPAVEWGGLTAGRLITAALAFAGTLCAAMLAGRLARPGQGRLAAVICFILALVNVYQAYFCTVVKTYSLAMLFLTAGFLVLHHSLARRNRFLVMLSAVLLVLAAGTRTSVAVVLPVVFGLLWLERRKLDFAGWLYFITGGIITALFVFGPFLLQCPYNFIYFAGRFHTFRHEGTLLSTMIFKAGFASRVLQAYFVCFALWVVALAIKWKDSACRGRQEPEKTALRQAAALQKRALWLCAIGISIVHFFAPFPYDDYQVFVYPLFAIVISIMILDALPNHAAKYLLPVILCLCLVSAVSSPINQDWFIEGRDLIWWKAKDRPPLIKLRQTADKIRQFCQPGDLLLTQDPYLAVEAGCALPHGLELGQFSFFPGLTGEEAKKMNVLNRDTFAELLQNCTAPIAAFSGYSFAIQSPEITPFSPADKYFFEQIVSNRYDLIEAVGNFGQASTELRIYRNKQRGNQTSSFRHSHENGNSVLSESVTSLGSRFRGNDSTKHSWLPVGSVVLTKPVPFVAKQNKDLTK